MKTTNQPVIDSIRKGLREFDCHDVDVHAFEQLGSTSLWLNEQRAHFNTLLDAGRPQLCITDWQQSGVGRRGKRWQTQPGNITFSVLSRVHKPAAQLLGLSLVTGIAVAVELERILEQTVMLKWPNDIIVQNRKLGGLLTELVSCSDAPTSNAEGGDSSGLAGKQLATDIIIGIGINVNHDDEVSGLGIGATSLNQSGIQLQHTDRDELVGSLCGSVLASHARFMQHQWAPFEQAWAIRDWLKGKEVAIHQHQTVEHGVACGVNEEGALLVRNAGRVTPLYGGNISIRPTV